MPATSHTDTKRGTGGECASLHFSIAYLIIYELYAVWLGATYQRCSLFSTSCCEPDSAASSLIAIRCSPNMVPLPSHVPTVVETTVLQSLPAQVPKHSPTSPFYYPLYAEYKQHQIVLIFSSLLLSLRHNHLEIHCDPL